MIGATAGRTIHLNQSTTINTESKALFISVRGVAFITILFLAILLLTIIPSSAQIANGNFTNGLTSWNLTYTNNGYACGFSSLTNIIQYPCFTGMGNGSRLYAYGGYYSEGDGGSISRSSILSQKVDLTGRNILKFRGSGAGATSTSYGMAYSYFCIDGVLKVFISTNQEYIIDTSAYTGKHDIQFISWAAGSSTHTSNYPCTTYIDYVRIVDEPATIPTLPSSSGVISFKNDPYTNIDAVELTLNENIVDWQSYDCVGDACSWQPAYHWDVLNPLFYYQDVPIIRVWEGTYENNTWHTIDTNPFLESGVSLVENPYNNNLVHQFTDSKNITSTDAAFLRADFVIRRDWYSMISFDDDNHIVFKQIVASVERVEDSDYAYHTPLANTNVTIDNPPAIEYVPPQDNLPAPSDMIRDDTGDLPDTVDMDNDGVPDNVDDDDDGNGMDDTVDSDNDTLPDVIDPEDTNPDNDGSTVDHDTDKDGVSDQTDNDIDGDGAPNDSDPDDDNDGIPDPIDGSDQNSTIPDPYQNSTYEGYLPANNSTFTYSVLKGYYSTVDGVFAPIDSGVTGVIGFVTSPVYSLSSSINSVNGYAVSVFSSTTVAIQPASLIMEAVFDSMPDKVKGIVSYYILLTLVLIILGRSW